MEREPDRHVCALAVLCAQPDLALPLAREVAGQLASHARGGRDIATDPVVCDHKLGVLIASPARTLSNLCRRLRTTDQPAGCFPAAGKTGSARCT